jgi:hypothetical protein
MATTRMMQQNPVGKMEQKPRSLLPQLMEHRGQMETQRWLGFPSAARSTCSEHASRVHSSIRLRGVTTALSANFVIDVLLERSKDANECEGGCSVNMKSMFRALLGQSCLAILIPIADFNRGILDRAPPAPIFQP